MAKKAGLICILALACMFVTGQAWAQCSPPPPPVDTDGDGIADGADMCPTNPDNVCALNVKSGCDTYIAPHPIYPGATTCGGGTELCVVELEFCANGTAHKRWDPDPGNPPGPTDATGTWSYAGTDLNISTTDPDLMDQGMKTEESYDVAYLYRDGSQWKLDLSGQAKGSSGLAGTYSSLFALDTTMPPDTGTLLNLSSTTDTTVVVDASGNWDRTIVVDITCSDGMGGVICASYTGSTTDDSGIGATEPDQLGSRYVIRVDDSSVYVKQ